MVECRREIMDAIGGYFSLELPWHEEYHKNAIKLNTGRNCLEYILRCRKYKKVYIPYYTCEVILEPFQKTGVSYDFYHINLDFEIVDDIVLQKDEALLYTNYYGLKQNYVEILAYQYGKQLIVDNTQAFFANPINGVDTFYTCRKFFGVPDGAYLYTDVVADFPMEQDTSYERMNFLTKRIDLSAEDGYGDFRKSDDGLDGQPVKRMSKLTERLMQSVDYQRVKSIRKKNFCLFHEALLGTNQLHVVFSDETVPMVYPYMIKGGGLRDFLIQNKVFVAKYWPNVEKWTSYDSMERRWPDLIIPLPIDQRYNDKDIKYIITKINNYK